MAAELKKRQHVSSFLAQDYDNMDGAFCQCRIKPQEIFIPGTSANSLENGRFERRLEFELAGHAGFPNGL